MNVGEKSPVKASSTECEKQVSNEIFRDFSMFARNFSKFVSFHEVLRVNSNVHDDDFRSTRKSQQTFNQT